MKKNISRLSNPDSLNGTSLKGTINGIAFIELFAVLGAPDAEETDGSQFEWHIDFKGQPICIYDWHKGDRIQVLDQNRTWNIGSNANVADFIEHLDVLVKQNR